MTEDLLLVLALRFLFFDHKSLKGFRNWIWKKGGTLARDLLECTFCQGFWVSVLLYPDTAYWKFHGAAAIVSYGWSILVYPRMEEVEEISHKMRIPGEKE